MELDFATILVLLSFNSIPVVTNFNFDRIHLPFICMCCFAIVYKCSPAVFVCTVLAAFSHSKFTLLCEQAYASYMKGSVSFELQNWKEAFELFGHAQ